MSLSVGPAAPAVALDAFLKTGGCKAIFCDVYHIAGAAVALNTSSPYEGGLRWPDWFVPHGGSLVAVRGAALP